jgi:hypothetical protein
VAHLPGFVHRPVCRSASLSDLLASPLPPRSALLMKEALEEISQTKRARYEAWRRSTLGGFKLGRRLMGMFMWTLAPALLALYVSQSCR